MPLRHGLERAPVVNAAVTEESVPLPILVPVIDQHRTEASSEIDLWFTERYGERLARRAKTMHRALQLCKQPPLIVETGSLRSTDRWDGDGQSTVVFADYVNRYGGLLISCDIDSAALATARALLNERGILSARTLFICSSSIDLLGSLRSPIDLLYMDSLDFDPGEPEPSLAHHLIDLCIAIGASGHKRSPA
jgi:hypothetical protein